MRAHLVQFDIAWEDRFRNFEKVDHLVRAARTDPGDFVLLPEMFDSGFSVNTAVTADRNGETLAFLQKLATALGIYVQAGRTVHPPEHERASNVATAVSPSGAVLAEFAKIHLFPLGKEPEMIRPGGEICVWKWEGPSDPVAKDPDRDRSLTVLPAICYDLRFPELFRAGLRCGAELIALGACWLDTRQSHWKPLLTARAIENQAFVLGVNRVGTDPNARYIGGTIAVGPRGEILGELGDEESVLSVEIDPAEVRRWRQIFPAWKDARILDDPTAIKRCGS